MNTLGDIVEFIVRMSLQGFEFVVKLTGSGTKNIVAIMFVILKLGIAIVILYTKMKRLFLK